MPATTIFDINEIVYDLLNSLRVNLNSVDPRARITEDVSNYKATAGQTIFPVDTDEMSYIKSVTVNAVAKQNHTDYTINWGGDNQGSVQFNSGLSLNDVVSIVWGNANGSSNFIYSDFPRTDISENTQPRIGFEITDSSKLAGAAGGTGYGIFHDLLIQIRVVGRDVYEVNTICQAIKNYIEPNAKNFYYFRFIEPNSMQQFDNFNDHTKQSFAKQLEYQATQKLQIVTYA